MIKTIAILATGASVLAAQQEQGRVGSETVVAHEAGENAPALPSRSAEVERQISPLAQALLEQLRASQDAETLAEHFESIRDGVFDMEDLLESTGFIAGESAALDQLLDEIKREERRLASEQFYGDLYLAQILGIDEQEEAAAIACTPELVEEALGQYRQHLASLLPLLQEIRDADSAQAAIEPLQKAALPLPEDVFSRLQVVDPVELRSRLGSLVEDVLEEAARLLRNDCFGVDALKEILKTGLP